MDQFGIELDHGEMALDLTENNEDKFSPRRTRSGRVFETKSARRRRQRHTAQDSDRSRNSSGQSGSGSLDESSENDESEMNSEGDQQEYSGVFSYLKRNPRCRLNLSESSQEVPITSSSSFMFDGLLSPRKHNFEDRLSSLVSSPLKSPTLPMRSLHLSHVSSPLTPHVSSPPLMIPRHRRLSSEAGGCMECDSTSSERVKLANINPFSPSARGAAGRKRNNSQKSLWSCNGSMEAMDGSYTGGQEELEEEEFMNPLSPGTSKRLKVSDINISRYEEEFVEMERIACGEFGVVKKARHRLDGMVYAIKTTKKPLKDNTRSEKTAMKEIFAGAAMMKHKHVVRYYNSWVEAGTVFIQNEFCDGGSLGSLIEAARAEGRVFCEAELRRMMRDIAAGLQYVHGKDLAHLDVKPGNILICHQEEEAVTSELGELGYCDTEDRAGEAVYKLADFGHVAPLHGQEVEPEEGDCRYMAPELLCLVIRREKLASADIFSLGLTIFEAASLMVMPRNSLDDPCYESLKAGQLPHLSQYSEDLNSLLASMVRPDPDTRPRAEDVLASLGQPPATITRSELYRELEQTRQKLSFLENKLGMKNS